VLLRWRKTSRYEAGRVGEEDEQRRSRPGRGGRRAEKKQAGSWSESLVGVGVEAVLVVEVAAGVEVVVVRVVEVAAGVGVEAVADEVESGFTSSRSWSTRSPVEVTVEAVTGETRG